MNVTEDFISVEESGGLKPAGPALPTLFGLTLTPMMIGVLIMVLGLVGGLYLIFNQLIPASEKSQKLQADLAQKQAQVQQKQVGLKKSEQVKTQLVRQNNNK